MLLRVVADELLARAVRLDRGPPACPAEMPAPKKYSDDRRRDPVYAGAIEDDVNLAVTLEAADERVREWVANNALPHGRLGPHDVWAQLMAD